MRKRLVGYLIRRKLPMLTTDPLYRNSFFFAFSSIFNAGCGFFFWMIAAKLYTIEDVGMATALISSLGLIILFSRLGFDSSIIRYFSLDDKKRIFNTSLILTTVGSMITSGVYIVFSSSVPILKEPIYALSFLMIGIINSIATISGSAFIADRKADYYFLQNIFMALRIPALWPLATLGVFGIFGSVGLGYLAASVYGIITINRSIAAISPLVDRKFIHRSLSFSVWNYISNILSVAPTLITPIMVLNMFGEAEAAKYYIAFAIGNLVLIIPNSFGTSLFVEGSHGEGLRKTVLHAASASFALLFPLVLIFLQFGDLILGLLKSEYMDAFNLLQIIALSSFPVVVYSLFISMQNVRMRVESIVKLNFFRFVLLLGLTYVLLIRYGTIGAGYAWFITYVIVAIIIVYTIWRESLI